MYGSHSWWGLSCFIQAGRLVEVEKGQLGALHGVGGGGEFCCSWALNEGQVKRGCSRLLAGQQDHGGGLRPVSSSGLGG